MNRMVFTAGLSAAAVLAVAVAPASATIIGGSNQQSQQGVNGSQLSNAPTATGVVIVVGPTSSAPSRATQNATSAVINAQSVGTDTGGDPFISPNKVGPLQSSEQGVNALQGSANSAIGTQNLTNVLGSSQIIGGDQACLFGGGCLQSTIIGSPGQNNEQALNYQQNADGGLTTGDSYLLPNVAYNGLVGPTSQNAFNIVLNSQMILGWPASVGTALCDGIGQVDPTGGNRARLDDRSRRRRRPALHAGRRGLAADRVARRDCRGRRTLMVSLLPAFATVIGAAVLGQIPSVIELAGVGLVAVGVAVHRSGLPGSPARLADLQVIRRRRGRAVASLERDRA